MKQLMSMLVLGVFAVSMLTANGQLEQQRMPQPADRPIRSQDALCDCEDPVIQELEDHETAGLLLMREEEKLARDVYTKLGELWNDRLFFTIAASESRHMEAVKHLLDRYGIEDPAADDVPGVFRNQELQHLYDTLVQRGSESLEAALAVGALVEDLDIKDLQDLISATDKEDIIRVYENLMHGSIRHIQSFIGRLNALGETYEAQFITQEELDTFIDQGREDVREAAGGNMQRRGMPWR